MLGMLTAIVHPPPLTRLWSVFALALVGLFASMAFLSPPGLELEAPPLLVPFAALTLAGLVGYTFREQLTATPARTLLTVFGLAFIALAFHAGGAAFAQEATDSAVGVVKPTESTVITIDAAVLSFAVGSLMPLLTALATKLKASPAIKGIVNLVLSIAGGVLAAFVANSGSLTVLEILTAAIVVYLASGSTYSHIWKPTGVVDVVAGAPPAGEVEPPRASRGLG